MDLTEAIFNALYGNAVLFIGSGFAAGAFKADGSEFMTASPFAHKLLEKCGYAEEDYFDDLGEAAQIFRDKFSDSELTDLLRDEFSACSVTDTQKIIASLPWMRVYTTNYDNVFELAGKSESINRTSAVLSDSLSDFKNKNRLVVHLNGDVSRLNPKKLDNEFRLTDGSYLSGSIADNEWIGLFRSDLCTASVIFFIGYSFRYDLDIRRIVSSYSESVKKTFFIVSEGTSDYQLDRLRRFGTPAKIGLDNFAQMVNKAIPEYKASNPIKSQLPLFCFEKPSKSACSPEARDSDEFNLLTKGEVNYGKLLFSILTPDITPYAIKRTVYGKVINLINRGCSRILIHSDLGNGKTIFMDGLGMLLANKGHKVFHYRRWGHSVSLETEAICSRESKAVILVDDYNSNNEVIDALIIHHSDQILIFSERSATNDIAYDRIRDAFGDFSQINLNYLDKRECRSLSNLLSYHGLWGKRASLTQDKKTDYINNKCLSQIKNVILDVLHSPQILDKNKDIIDSLQKQHGFYDAVLFILIAQVARLNITLDDVAYAIGLDRINSPQFSKNSIVREFINFDDLSLRVKSSLVASIILQEIENSSHVADLLYDIFTNIDQLPKVGKEERQHYKHILNKLMQFSNIQKILSRKDTGYSDSIRRYYMKLKSKNYCRQRPLFWLQYAIMKLAEYNYPEARQFFATAYSLAKDKNDRGEPFDTYQIDNHYARFILQNEVECGSYQTCIKAFTQAHELLSEQGDKEGQHYYPYRVACNYLPFYKKFFRKMTVSEKQYFISACRSMLAKINKYLSHASGSQYRQDVLRAKENILQILHAEQPEA